MRVIFASAAYLTAMAGGVNILIASAHSLASLATPMLQLPAAKQSSAPTLVERRLIAQSAPEPVNVPLRTVVAYAAPDMPVAQLAARLDEAETAYQPETDAEIIDVRAAPPPAMETARPPALMTVALEIARVELSKNSDIAELNRATPKSSKSPALSKRKGKPTQIAKTRASVRLASLETPGNLMFRGLLKRQS